MYFVHQHKNNREHNFGNNLVYVATNINRYTIIVF